MDIAALSMGMAQTNLKMNVGVALSNKAMNKMEEDGAQLVEMLKQSAPKAPHPTLGRQIDIQA